MAGDEPTVIGDRYQLVRKLGVGGMAEVWLASDRRLNDKYVAVKRLHSFRSADEAAVDVERARREAFAVSQLSHPNLVAVTDFIAEGGEPFIVMEYVDGTTLDDLLATGAPAAARLAKLLGQVADALAEAHRMRIVHRDIKPANIMVSGRGDAKLADFGIARAADDPRLTRTGAFTGTIRYLAPEILDGRDATPASDVWALGATLFEAIEGRPAFDGQTTVALMGAIAMAPVPESRRVAQLTALIARMLDRDPAARPTADEVAGQLRAYAADPGAAPAVAVSDATRVGAAGWALPTTPTPTTPPTPTPTTPPTSLLARSAGSSRGSAPGRPKPKRRNRAYLLVAVPVALAVAVGVPLALNSGGTDHPTAAGDPQASRSLVQSVGAPPAGSATTQPTIAQSSPPLVGGAAPGGPTPVTVRFAGVIVHDARDLASAPRTSVGAITAPTAIEYRDLVRGSGSPATASSTVRVRYVGLLAGTGRIFGTTWKHRAAVSLDLARVIPGLRRGIAGSRGITAMRPGGRRIVIVPARLGYRAAAHGPVPAHSTLVYVIDLVASPPA